MHHTVKMYVGMKVKLYSLFSLARKLGGHQGRSGHDVDDETTMIMMIRKICSS
jgi:hypothetical protein